MSRRKTGLRVLTGVLILIFVLAAAGAGYYWYDGHIDRSGWVMKDELYSYRDFHNRNVTGWQDIDGRRYYFDEEGIMQTGWLDQDGSRYYLDTDGTLVTGWFTMQEDRYYLNEDGVLQTGLLDLDDSRYLLDEDGRMVTGLQVLEDDTYFFTPEGPAVTGPYVMDGQAYSFGSDGRMQTGWVECEGGKQYYLPEGPMAYGFREIDGQHYFLEEETGFPHIGWLQDGEYNYYFGEDGAALTGPQKIDGKQYYFSPKGISVFLVNASNPIPDDYDPQLETLTGWHRISKIALEPMRQMLRECKLAGKEPAINSIYRSGKNQEAIMEQRIEEFMDAGMSYEQAYAKVHEIVAPPGTSEHETGLSADLVGEEAKKWLAEHCWEYGFILRYPEEKGDITGITFEPWHFRYVGERVSMDMKDSGLCLEEYLGAGPAKP